MIHEPVTQKILEDFVNVIKPKWVKLICDWGARGGLKTVTGLSYKDGNYGNVPLDENTLLNAQDNWDNM